MEKFERQQERYNAVLPNKSEVPFLTKRLFEPNAEQIGLTESMILPYSEEIIDDATALRDEVDAVVFKTLSTTGKKKYPKGYCGEIRNEFLSQLHGAMMDRSRVGFSQIKEFVRKGGVVAPFWASYQNEAFQNAIQIGSSILDVADDTLTGKGEKVRFYKTVAESPFIPLSSYEQCADIAETYWNYKIFPNIYFPELAPFYPMLRIRKVHDNPSVYALALLDSGIAKNIGLYDYNNATATQYVRERMALARKFVLTGKYSKRRLPPNMIEAVIRKHPELKSYKPSFDIADTESVFDRYVIPLKGESPSEEVFRNLVISQGKELLEIESKGTDYTRKSLLYIKEKTFQAICDDL